MRVNVYNEEITDRVELATKVANTVIYSAASGCSWAKHSSIRRAMTTPRP